MKGSVASGLLLLALSLGISLLGLVTAVLAATQAESAPPPGAFQRLCAACHGEGSGHAVVPLPRPFPYDAEFVRATARDGRGEMPAFSEGQVSDADLNEIATFLRSEAPR